MEAELKEQTKIRLNAEDQSIQLDYLKQLEQAQKNVDQGVFGMELAKTKIDSIKGSFVSLAENIQSESKFIKEETDLEIQQTKLTQLTTKSDKILGDIDQVKALQQRMAEDTGEKIGTDSIDKAQKKINDSLAESKKLVTDKASS